MNKEEDYVKCSFCGEVVEGASNSEGNKVICFDCLSKLTENAGIIFDEEPIELKEIERVFPKEIKETLDKSVIGQEKAKKAISVALSQHIERVNSDGEISKKNNLLIGGPTGSGKTLMAKTLLKKLEIPYIVTQATQLSKTGYMGQDATSLVLELVERCGSIKEAERGVIIIDEIDKIAKAKTQDRLDVSGIGVQQDLLKIIEGANINISDPRSLVTEMVNTENILFIGLGAFQGITDFSPASLVDYGLMQEFVGRFPIVTETNKLTKEEVLKVLEDSEVSPVNEYKKMFKRYGVELNFSREALDMIAKTAHSDIRGVRALNGVIEDIMLDISFAISEDKKGTTCSIHFEDGYFTRRFSKNV